MSRKEDIFKEVLTNAYSHDNFVDFSREIISGLNLGPYSMETKPWNTFSAFISKYFVIGDFTDPDGNKVGVFSVELLRGESVDRARTAQRTFVKTLLENGGYAAALVAFYSPDSDKWRFSFVRMDYEFAKGKIKESLTPARRYSYLVGKGEPCHTAQDRLLPIFMDDSRVPTIDEIEEAFSVEKVTKDFFEAYKDKYLQLADYLNTNEDFVRESKLKGFTTEQFTKKLLSQIVFLYFIQKKGWLGVNAVPKVLTEKQYKNAFFSHGSKSRELVGKVYYQDGDVYRLNANELRSLSDEDENEFSKCVKGQPWGTGPKDFMRKIYENAVKREQNFFDDCLEPLFYTGLNQDRGENAFFPPLHCRIPFLNGGLFEELDHYDWQHNNFGIPNELFSNVDEKGREADGILDIFDRYNFTMAEDEPLEKEVAVDPEMLGKVFENLLEVKDRKSKGAFYTPREIVHYMCSESLINYLVTKSGILEEDIRKFITLGEFFKDDDARRTLFNKETRKFEYDYNKRLEMPASILDFKNNVNRLTELDDLLANVKVVDPAVGSGAFPLGLLNEIVKARDTITTYMAIPMGGFQRKVLYAQRSPYQLKTQTIKNCIYACDIEPSATDITKLRLWLALVIEDEIGDQDKDEFGEHTKPRKLPNLDCNIICGNSLVDSFEGIDLICNTEALGNQEAGTNVSMADKLIEGQLNSLIELQDRLYNASSTGEKEEIKKNIQVYYDAIIMEQLQTNPEAMKKYADMVIANVASKPFILWPLYFPKVFKDNGGFDICIGNPPYGADIEKKIQDYYRKKYNEVQFKIDSYVLFILEGLELCRPESGILSYIIPNTLLNNYFLCELRKTLVESNKLTHLINFDDSVFTATVHSLILQVQKKKTSDNNVFTAWNLNQNIHIVKQDSFASNDNYAFEFTDGNSGLIDRLRREDKKLEDVLDLRQAIKSGNDKKYITSQPVGNAKKILRGKDVLRYRIKDPELFIDYGKHLACPRDEQIFLQPHILIREAGKTITATIDYDQFYIMSSLYCGIMKTQDVPIEYVMGLINSKLFQYLMYKINFENTKGAFTKAKIYHYNQLPMIIPDDKKLVTTIVNNVKRIIDGEESVELEENINMTVYKIYGLDSEEIAEIDSKEY
ncbi:MAG: N-6 DNA methylase [Parasporobacterium sp.]|nr:N-6 DNA methylase [Parasporobacterium sp.]